MKSRRRTTRAIYVGTLRAGILSLQRGAFLRIVDAEGAIEKDVKDNRSSLCVNLGDRIVLSGAAENENAVAEVTRIEPGWNERLHVKQVAGFVPDGAVHVMNAKGLGR